VPNRGRSCGAILRATKWNGWLESRQPVVGLTTMTGNRQDLNNPTHFAIDEIEVEDLKADTPNGRRKNNLMTMRCFTGKNQRSTILGMIAAPQTGLALLIVSDLFPVFRRCIWMKPILHLKSAWT